MQSSDLPYQLRHGDVQESLERLLGLEMGESTSIRSLTLTAQKAEVVFLDEYGRQVTVELPIK